MPPFELSNHEIREFLMFDLFESMCPFMERETIRLFGNIREEVQSWYFEAFVRLKSSWFIFEDVM